MISPGLVSISFRSLSPTEIVALVQEGGLSGIEWGGDVHVPHGDVPRAREVRRLTEEAGLQVAAYGSYYRVGHSEESGTPREQQVSFERVLESARELGAPSVRVWAGAIASSAASANDWQRIIADAHRIGSMAAVSGIVVAYEYHASTLTDTPAAALRLLQESEGSGLRTLWQPTIEADVQTNRSALQQVLPWLLNLHVYHWKRSGTNFERRALQEGEAEWHQYLETVEPAGGERWALLEFVRDDAPAAFLEDAVTLRQWLNC